MIDDHVNDGVHTLGGNDRNVERIAENETLDRIGRVRGEGLMRSGLVGAEDALLLRFYRGLLSDHRFPV